MLYYNLFKLISCKRCPPCIRGTYHLLTRKISRRSTASKCGFSEPPYGIIRL